MAAFRRCEVSGRTARWDQSNELPEGAPVPTARSSSRTDSSLGQAGRGTDQALLERPYRRYYRSGERRRGQTKDPPYVAKLAGLTREQAATGRIPAQGNPAMLALRRSAPWSSCPRLPPKKNGAGSWRQLALSPRLHLFGRSSGRSEHRHDLARRDRTAGIADYVHTVRLQPTQPLARADIDVLTQFAQMPDGAVLAAAQRLNRV